MRILLALLAACALSPSHAQAPQPEPFKASAPLSLELRNAQWFDGQAFRRGTLYVNEGRFTTQKPKRVNRRMDLKSQFLIPPLAEAHNYNLQNEWGVAHYAQRYLQDGVFYAAMLCADPADVASVRGKLSGEASPDVLFVTACVTSSDGQPLGALVAGSPNSSAQDFADKTVLLMDRPEDVDRKWPLVGPRNTDAVKLVLSYSDRPELRGRPELAGKLGMAADTAAAVVRQSHKSGLRVIAHVDDAADFEVAVRAGADLIAHLPGHFNHHGDGPERYLISPEIAALAARQKTAVITATATTALFQPAPDQHDILRRTQSRNLQTLKAAGVTLLLGSDVFTDTSLVELRNLASLNSFSNAELLRMASVDTPRALFPARRLGCFDEGCEASFLLLAGNPLQDIAAVGKPLLRVKQGRLLTQLEDVAESSSATTDSTEAQAKAKNGKKSGKASKAKPGGKTAKPAAKPATKSTAKRATPNR